MVGISGRGKDFEVLLLSDDDYLNWSTGHDYRAFWSSGKVTVTSIDTLLRAPGSFNLVVSNTFSLLQTKVVTVDADVTCPVLGNVGGP